MRAVGGQQREFVTAALEGQEQRRGGGTDRAAVELQRRAGIAGGGFDPGPLARGRHELTLLTADGARLDAVSFTVR